MFGWRRRNEGFEWRSYVRTTVLMRRADRQRKIDEAQMAALAKAKDVRDKGVAAGQAGLATVTSTLRDIAVAAARGIWSAVQGTAATLFEIARALVLELRRHLPQLPALPSPRFSLPRFSLTRFSLARARMARLSKFASAWSPARRDRSRTEGDVPAPDGEALRPDAGFRLPFGLRFTPQMLGGVAFAALLVVVGGPMLSGGGPEFAAPRAIPTLAAGTTGSLADGAGASRATLPSELSGRAVAVRGDVLRISGYSVKLASIEAPARAHPCVRSSGRRWDCSAAAQLALRRLIRGQRVLCRLSGERDGHHLVGTCTADGQDVADVLVREGSVFAAPGYFASYGDAERAAQEKHLGLWQSAATPRPETWRNQLWEDAKRARPDGCPIKGFARATDRTYALPWSDDYARRAVREGRGDRWFCSEDEAQAAGFTRTGRL